MGLFRAANPHPNEYSSDRGGPQRQFLLQMGSDLYDATSMELMILTQSNQVGERGASWNKNNIFSSSLLAIKVRK